METLHSISQLIVKTLVAPLILALSFSGYSVEKKDTPQNTLGAFHVSGGGTYRLKTTAGSSDTSIQLSSFKEPISNIPYTMSYLNTSIGFGTLDPQQPTRSEFVSFTGITQNSDGSATLTGVTRGIPRTPSYEGSCNVASTTLQQSHSGQSIFILSDSPCLFSQYAVKGNNELISGAWIASSSNPFSYDSLFNITSSSTSTIIPTAGWIYNNFVRSNENTTINATTTAGTGKGFVQSLAPTNGSDLANKTYVDGVAIAGAPNATTGVKGIVQIATQSEVIAGTAIGSTGASLVVTPATLLGAGAIATLGSYSTSTLSMTGTSTISGIPSNNNIQELAVHFFVASTTPAVDWKLSMNGSLVPFFNGMLVQGNPNSGLNSINNNNLPTLTNSGSVGGGAAIDLVIASSSSRNKVIQIRSTTYTSTGGVTGDMTSGQLLYATSAPITSISFSPTTASASLASTSIIVLSR